MTSRLHTKLTAMAATAALLATPAMAEKANQLVDINGMDAWGAEQALKSRGFKSISSHKSHHKVTSYWWDEGDDDCVSVEVSNDTVQRIRDASDQDCGHHEGNAAAAVGAVAGVALLGALLSHKSHHHDDEQHHSKEEEDQQFERGYRDGLHNASYHNYDRSEFYSRGYSAGVEEREANLRHHHRRGGYHPAVSYADLDGARAAGAMMEIERRGFEQVDNFTSGNTRYSIQWNDDTRQCVQMTIADGRIYDIRDIGQHPKCR